MIIPLKIERFYFEKYYVIPDKANINQPFLSAFFHKGIYG
jgi:hypothetical protein